MRLVAAALAIGAAALSSAALGDAPSPAAAQTCVNAGLAGDIAPVHDPAIIREGDTYHLFATNSRGAISWRRSEDLATWTLREPVFAGIPEWATKEVPGAKGMWAPDIVKIGDEFRLYYSISTFGSNRSAIGLAATPTLDRSSPRFGWVDRGLVWRSTRSSDHNAIDPNIVIAEDGRHWMAFGSFWTGIKLIELDPATGKPLPGARLHSIARRPDPGAVEAPFIIRRNGHYYLFASYDFCCRGAKSSYYTVVGRSAEVTGPYVDRDGKPMMQGGGLLVLHAQLEPAKRFAGPGHVAILREKGADYIVYHAYDKRAQGRSTLRIKRLGWTADGWPVAIACDAERRR